MSALLHYYAKYTKSVGIKQPKRSRVLLLSASILPQQQASKFANTTFFSEKLPHPRPLIAKSSLDHANACDEEVYLLQEERLDEGAIHYLHRIDPGGVKELLKISWQH